MRKNKKAMLVFIISSDAGRRMSADAPSLPKRKAASNLRKQHPQKHPLMQALKKQKQIQMERPLPMRAMVS